MSVIRAKWAEGPGATGTKGRHPASVVVAELSRVVPKDAMAEFVPRNGPCIALLALNEYVDVLIKSSGKRGVFIKTRDRPEMELLWLDDSHSWIWLSSSPILITRSGSSRKVALSTRGLLFVLVIRLSCLVSPRLSTSSTTAKWVDGGFPESTRDSLSHGGSRSCGIPPSNRADDGARATTSTLLLVGNCLSFTVLNAAAPGMQKQANIQSCVKPTKQYGENAQQLLDITFADDTSLLCREKARLLLEDQLQSTLSPWGEELKPSKTKRLLISPELPSNDFKTLARILGGWLSHTALHERDDKRDLLQPDGLGPNCIDNRPVLLAGPYCRASD